MADEAEARNLTPGQEDVFGMRVAQVIESVLDVPSQYPINPERLRLFVNGTRQFTQYGSVAEYNHVGPVHEITPQNQGDTVTLQTAERARYRVGFEQIYSLAVSLSRSLEGSDRLRVGPFNDSDGWYLENRGDQDDHTVDLVVREAGTDTTDKQDATLPSDITKQNRSELRTAWYRVTRQLWRQSYEQSDQQQTETVGRTGIEGGPETANLPVRFELTRGGSSPPITLKAGSIALLTQGQKSDRRRRKTHAHSLTTDANADGTTWFPRYAIRLDPARELVNTQIPNVSVMAYGGAGSVRCLVQAHDATKVKDSGGNALVGSDFSVPQEHNAQNSVIEETTAAEQAADSTGAIAASAGNPGGYQIGYASLYASGQGSGRNITRSADELKRALYGGDIGVLWVRADDAGVNLTVEFVTEQDW